NALQGLDDFRTASLIGARRGGIIPNLAFLGAILLAARIDLLTLQNVLVLQIIFHLVALIFAVYVLISYFRRVAASSVEEDDSPRKDDKAPTYSTVWFAHQSWPNLITQLMTRAIVE